MRHFLPFLLTCLLGYGVHAQRSLNSEIRKNELKLNSLYLPGGYLELSYERLLGPRSSIGASVGALLGSPGPNYATDILTYEFGLLPFYRRFFGKRPAFGFFLEGNGLVYARETHETSDRTVGVGLGLGLGVKVPLKRQVFLELHAGGGYNFNRRPQDSNDTNWNFLQVPDLYPRLGVVIGTRI